MPFGSPKYTSPVSSLTIMMSTPFTNSSFKVDEETSSSYITAGLKFAKSPRAFLIPKSAFSGLIAGSRVSYFQSPTAPRKTASEFFASSRVFSGSGPPVSSIAAPPINP